jgi:acetylornithine deacetylase/succinyl-diaminopimelate desuccinylase family protein
MQTPSSTAEKLSSAIRRQLERDEADLVEFASELIRIPSENPPGKAYPECAALIETRLRGLGLRCQILDPSGVGPCVAGTYGEAGRALYFSGHYDVVPARDPSQFDAQVRKGRLYGRGSADMKGGIAAMVFAVRALVASGFEPKGRLISMSVPDEETSGPHGTVALIEAGLIEHDSLGMLTMEPTGGVVWNASRGVISLRISVHGKPAHVGLHFRGTNAFTGMLIVAGLFEDLNARVSKRMTRFDIEPEAARRSVLLMGGELTGGQNFNVVPDSVSFTVDRRPNPEEDFDAEREALLQVVEEARSRGVDCDVEVFQVGRSASTDSAGEVGQALAESIQQVTGETPRFGLCPGVLETRHYTAIGIPALAYGPGLLSVSHGPDEFVSVGRLLECAEVYALTAARLLA